MIQAELRRREWFESNLLMNEPPLPDDLVWGVCRPFFELLLTVLPVAVLSMFLTVLILISFCCRETTRARRRNDRAAGHLPA